MNKKVTKKAAPKKKSAPKNQTNKQKDALRTNEPEFFKILDGIPDRRTSITEVEKEKVRKLINDLVPNKTRFIIPNKIKQTVRNIANEEFPQFSISFSQIKEKKCWSVWRTI